MAKCTTTEEDSNDGRGCTCPTRSELPDSPKKWQGASPAKLEELINNHYSVCPSVCLSVCPSVRLSIRPSIRPSVCLSVCPSFRLSVCPSIHPSIRPSVCPSNRLSVRPSPPSHINASIHIGQEIWCLPYAGFFLF